ncbi:MAG: ABC-2 family transporter protein [Thermodesulfobacteriota bacterium]
MIRYLRLYLYFLRFSFSRAMEFRLDFFFRVVMDTVFYLVHIIFFAIIYRHTALVGGWNYDQVLIFVCGFFVADALHMTVVANNLWHLPEYINKGDVDYHLVRPVSSLFFLSVRDFAANSFVNLLIALGLLGWAIGRYPGSFSPGQLLFYGLLIINGAYLYYLIHLLFILPVFWTHSARGFEAIFYSVKQFAERPDRVFHGPVRLLLVSLLPFLLIASYPAHVLLGDFNWSTMTHIVLVSLALTLLVLMVWRLGLRSYSSASS